MSKEATKSILMNMAKECIRLGHSDFFAGCLISAVVELIAEIDKHDSKVGNTILSHIANTIEERIL